MSLLQGDIEQFSELKIFIENIKEISDKINKRLKRKVEFNEIQYEYEKFYLTIFYEINEENILDLAKQLPKSLLNEIALANKILNFSKRIPISNRALETIEIVLNSLKELSKGKLKSLSILLKELIQLGKILNNQLITKK